MVTTQTELNTLQRQMMRSFHGGCISQLPVRLMVTYIIALPIDNRDRLLPYNRLVMNPSSCRRKSDVMRSSSSGETPPAVPLCLS